jgi:hypothetical protein
MPPKRTPPKKTRDPLDNEDIRAALEAGRRQPDPPGDVEDDEATGATALELRMVAMFQRMLQERDKATERRFDRMEKGFRDEMVALARSVKPEEVDGAGGGGRRRRRSSGRSRSYSRTTPEGARDNATTPEAGVCPKSGKVRHVARSLDGLPRDLRSPEHRGHLGEDKPDKVAATAGLR